MPIDLFDSASKNQPQASATRTTDTTAWVQPLEGTHVTLGDVQSLMDIQSRQFHQCMMDNLSRMQSRMAIATQALSDENADAMRNLRRDLRQEEATQSTQQAQEELLQNHDEELTELSKALRDDILPALRTQNAHANVPATPAQTQQQVPHVQLPPATPAQGQCPISTQPLQQHCTPWSTSLATVSPLIYGAPSTFLCAWDPSCAFHIRNHGQ
jgi:hypothetical protein